jgi:acylphosphatase
VATVTTTTDATPLGQPSLTYIDRDPTTGYLWAMVQNSTGGFEFFKSTNGGTTWATSTVSLVRANLQEVSGILIDNTGCANLAYRTNESSQDRVYFRRLILNYSPPTWQATETVVGVADNGGVAGSVVTGVDVHIVIRTDNTAHVVFALATVLAGAQGITLCCVDLDIYGTPTLNNTRFDGYRQWLHTGTGRITPALDIEHNGDGRTSAVPNLWCAYGRTTLWMVKLPWTGDTWAGPATDQTILTGLTAQDRVVGRWDGTRWLMAVTNPADSTTVAVVQRNQANTTSTTVTTPTHPTGVVKNCTAAYNVGNGDVRVYAVGTSTAVLYFVDYIRASGTWTSWATVTATAVLTSDQWGTRRSSTGSARYDVATTASGAPNTVSHTSQVLSYPPDVPAWVAPSTGVAQDVAVALLLDWTFSDPDPADTQSAYALSRQVGAGALNYWRASDSTWQVAEVKNVSGTSAVTLASSWAAGSDANYTFKVKVWDSADVASLYSAGVIVVPSVKVNPAITAPTAAQVLTASSVTATWTATEQTQYRITLATNPGGVVVYDSGWVTSTVRTLTVPYVLGNNTGWTLSLQTTNNEGLASAIQTVAFTVVYLAPPAPTLTATPSPSTGVINVAVTNPAPVGAQPVLASQDVWRRPVTTGQTVINTNPNFETNATDWTGVGGTAARSTAQFHQGGAALLITPTGGIADSYAESGKYPATTGTTYQAAAWIRPTTVNKNVTVALRWYTAGNAFVSATVLSSLPAAGGWLYLAVTDVPPATATQVTIAVGVTGTPAAGDTAYADEAALTVADPGVGVRVAAGIAAGATVADFKAVSGVAYEYRAVAAGTNGTTSTSPWTA